MLEATFSERIDWLSEHKLINVEMAGSINVAGHVHGANGNNLDGYIGCVRCLCELDVTCV